MFFEIYKNTRRFTRKLQGDGHTRIYHRPLVGEDERREACARHLRP